MKTKLKTRLTSIFLCLAMILSIVPGSVLAAATSGETGAVAWSLDANGVFTVTGTGVMADYASASDRPWHESAAQIKAVRIGSGVTNIGAYAFADCTNLTSVDIGTTVTTIGAHAFENTTSLTEAVIPEQVSIFSEGVFHNSGLKKLYIYSRKTEFDGFYSVSSDDDAFLPLDTVVYCYNCSHANFYISRPQVILTEGALLSVDGGDSTFTMDPNNEHHVANLWSAAQANDGSEESIALDYTFSFNAQDARRIHSLMVDDSYQLGGDYSNDGKLVVEVSVDLRFGGYDSYEFTGGAYYSFQETDLKGNANEDYGSWDSYGTAPFITLSEGGSDLTVRLEGTLKQMSDYVIANTDYTDCKISEIFIYMAVRGKTYYRGYGNGIYEQKSTTIDSAATSIYDAHQRESWLDQEIDMHTLDSEISVSDFAPFKDSLPAHEYAKYMEPVNRSYVWHYTFARESYFYDEETGEDIYFGDCFWDLEGEGIATEVCNGILYGGVSGSYYSGSDPSVSIRQMLSQEELEFVQTLRGVKPYGYGGEARIELSYTLYLTYPDGSLVTLADRAADEITSLAGVCLHSCSVCGLCTSEELLACNSQYGYRINECTCETPQPSIVASSVDDAQILDSETWSGEVTARVETFDAEQAVTTDYFKAVTADVGAYNILNVYDITLFNESGEPVKINEWGGTEEYVTLSIPVSAQVAEAAAKGELELYHVDENGVAELVPIIADTENNLLTFTGTQFSPFVLKKAIPYYGRQQLASLSNATALLYAYDQIVAGVESSEENINVYNGTDAITAAEFSVALDAYLRDYTHHFWLGNSYSLMSNDTTTLAFVPTYTMTGADLTAARQAFENAADTILAGLTDEMSEYERELYLHDQLASLITYQESTNAHNAYGALVEGIAVCEGYAEALQYLLRRADIQSFIAIGASENPATGSSENHAWNYVRIDGKYYHTDLTWNDQGKELYHAYFNQTDAVIKEDHVIETATYGLPTCDSAEGQFFTGKDTYLSSYTAGSVGALLKDSNRKVHVYIPGSVADFCSWYGTNILGIAQAAGIPTSLSYSYSQLGRELILELNPVCSHTYGTDHLCTKCGTEEEAYVGFYSLSLTGNIAINYYVRLSDAVAEDSSGYMRFVTPQSGSVDIPLSEAVKKTVSGKTYYVFTVGVAAKEMTKTVTGQYFYQTGSSDIYSYSVKEYADIILSNPNNDATFEKAKPLVQAMLTYGAYAQSNFGYNTGNMAAELADMSGITANTLIAFANKEPQGTDLVPLYGTSLILNTETTLRLFFRPDSSVTELTATMSGKPLTVNTSGNLAYVDIPDISAKNLDANYAITIYDGNQTAIVSYNPMAYCYSVLNAPAGTYTDTLLNTVRALYLYNQAANTYFG